MGLHGGKGWLTLALVFSWRALRFGSAWGHVGSKAWCRLQVDADGAYDQFSEFIDAGWVEVGWNSLCGGDGKFCLVFIASRSFSAVGACTDCVAKFWLAILWRKWRLELVFSAYAVVLPPRNKEDE